MKYARDENGYTLVLTLILVLLIFMFTASFTVASMNQNKQINKTDDRFIANSMAEMGVEHYSTLTEKSIEQKTNSIFVTYKKSTNALTFNQIRNNHFNEFKNEINSLLNNKVYLGSNNEYYYEVSNINIGAPSQTGVQFTLDIKGVSENSSETIKVDFDFNNVLNPSSNEMATPTEQSLPSLKYIVENHPDAVAKYTSGDYANHTSFPNNKILYFTVDTSFGQSFNDGLEGNTIFSDNQLLFLKHSYFKNVQLEAENLNLDVNNASQSYIQNSIFIVDTLTLGLNDSHKLPVTSGSKICVRNPKFGNDAFLNKITLSSDSWVYFKQDSGLASSLNSNSRVGLLNEIDFATTCNFKYIFSDYESNIGDIVEDINYQ